MKTKFVIAAYLLVGVVAAGSAHAAPVTFLFGGQIRSQGITAGAGLPEDIVSGQYINGTFTYESTASGEDLFGDVTHYSFAGTGMTADIGNQNFESNVGSVFVKDSTFEDYFVFLGFGFTQTGNDVQPYSLILRAFDTTASVFDSTNLPTPPADFSDFARKNFDFTFYQTSRDKFIRLTGVIDTLRTVGGVPVPAASALLIAGLAALGLRRRKA